MEERIDRLILYVGKQDLHFREACSELWRVFPNFSREECRKVLGAYGERDRLSDLKPKTPFEIKYGAKARIINMLASVVFFPAYVGLMLNHIIVSCYDFLKSKVFKH